jgi:GNAT superfamily N-acetyltransferase
MIIEIDRLTTEDVDDAWRLSSQVGWNQTSDDWQRLLKLFPTTCFAGRLNGELVATSTLATYGDVGWIGMVLVDEAHRRRGYGSKLFERALDAGHNRSLEVIGLDATDAGREVYRQYGFETVVGIDRWAGSLRRLDADEIEGYDADHGHVEPIETVRPIANFDRTHVGTDRRVLLEHLIAADDAFALRVNRNGRTRGYAVARSGRRQQQVGPIVAVDGIDVLVLLSGVAKRVDGPVIVDVLRGERTESLFRRFGLDVQRRLHRMTEGNPRSVLDGDAVVAAAGFEWG